jgi:hypothetical protein
MDECRCGVCEGDCMCECCKKVMQCSESYHCADIYDDRLNGVGIGGDENEPQN